MLIYSYDNNEWKDVTFESPEKPSQPQIPVVKTLAELDIKNKDTTDEYEYNRSEDLDVFSAKKGYAFSKIKQSTNIISQSKNENHALRVVLNENAKRMSVLLESGNLLFFTREGNNPWQDVTSTKYSTSDVKLFTKIGSEYKQLESGEYTSSLYYFSSGFALSDVNKCYQVRYNDNILWDYDKDPVNGFPLRLILNLITNDFYLTFQNNKSKKLKIDKPRDTSKAKKEPKPVSPEGPDDVKTQEEKKEPETSVKVPYDLKIYTESQSDKSMCVINDSSTYDFIKTGDNLIKYVFKDGFQYVQFEYRDKVLWTRDEQDPRSPKTLLMNTDNKIMILTMKDDLTYIYKCGFQLKSFYGVIPKPVELDIKKKKGNQSFNYIKEDKSKLASFVSKDDFVFKKVKVSGSGGCEVCIWEGKDHTEYGNRVIIDSPGNSKNVTIYLVNGIIKHFQKSKKNWLEKSKVIELDIKSSESTYEILYSKDEETETAVYTLNQDFIFHLVTESDQFIWRAEDPSQYSKKVCSDSKSNKQVKIYLVDGTVRQFYKSSKEQWLEKGCIILDLGHKNSCDEYTYSKENEVGTFVPNPGYSFRLVKNQNSEIWTPDGSVNANKVIVDGIGSVSKILNLSVGLTNGHVKHFSKSDNIWHERQPSVHLDIEKPLNFYEYNYSSKENISTYLPRMNFRIKSVKARDIDIWSSSGDNDCSNKVISDFSDPKCKAVTIHLVNGEVMHFNNINNEWKQKPHDIDLDIGKKETTRECKYRVEDGYGVFEPRENCHIASVSLKKKVIYTVNQANELVTKVCIDCPAGNTNNITLNLRNGKVLLYSLASTVWVKNECVTLDISKKSSVGKIEYSKEDNVHIFSPLDSFIINKVTDSGSLIYLAVNPVEYGSKLLLRPKEDTNPEFATLFFPSSKMKHFGKVRGQWSVKLPYIEVDVMDIKYKYEYTLTHDEELGVYNYSPNLNFLVSKVTCGKELVWEESNPKKYATKLLADTDNIVSKSAKSRKAKTLETARNQGKKKIDSKPIPKIITIFTANGETRHFSKSDNMWHEREALIDFDFSQLSSNYYYESKRDRGYNFTTFTPKHNFSFKTVKVGDQEIWKAGSKYSKKIVMTYFSSTEYITVYVDEEFFLYYKSVQNKYWIAEHNNQNSLSHFELFSFSSSSSGDPVLHNSLYKLFLNEFSYGYEFSESARCKEVHFKKRIIWHYSYLKFVLKKIQVNINTGYIYAHYTNGMIQKLDVTDGKSAEMHAPEPDYSDEIENANFIELDLNNKTSNEKYDYYENSLCGTYTAKGHYSFQFVKTGDVTIWTSSEPKGYSRRVVLSDKNLVIHVPNGRIKFTKIRDLWELNPQPFTLDISKDEDDPCEEYEYNEKGRLKRYTTTSDYIFNRVIEKLSFKRIKVIWEGKDPTRYARRVRIKSDKEGGVFLAVFQIDLKFELFYRGPDNAWTNINSIRHSPHDLKFFIKDDYCLRGYREVPKSNVKQSVMDFSYTIRFDGVASDFVTYQDQCIYDGKDHEGFNSITGIYLDLITDKFFIINRDGETKELDIKKRIKDKANITEPEPDEPVEPTTESEPVEDEVEDESGVNKKPKTGEKNP